jgi:hypothetical protein
MLRNGARSPSMEKTLSVTINIRLLPALLAGREAAHFSFCSRLSGSL